MRWSLLQKELKYFRLTKDQINMNQYVTIKMDSQSLQNIYKKASPALLKWIMKLDHPKYGTEDDRWKYTALTGRGKKAQSIEKFMLLMIMN
jgi:hypothetical protein